MRDLPRGTQVADHGGRSLRLRGYHPLWPAFPDGFDSRSALEIPPGPSGPPWSAPTTPPPKRLHPIARSRFGLFPFRSPLLRECSLFLPLLRCFSSRTYLTQAYLVQPGVTGPYPGRVSPFGPPRIKACSQPPEAFRRLPRPSSALGAKASPPCPV